MIDNDTRIEYAHNYNASEHQDEDVDYITNMNENNNDPKIPVVNNENDPRQRLYNQGTYPTLSKTCHISYIRNDITPIYTDCTWIKQSYVHIV